MLADAIQRVGALAAAQQILYSDSNPRRFSIGALAQAVCQNARQALPKRISIRVEDDGGELLNDASLPLALILNELLANAAKHGGEGREGRDIAVALRRAENEVVLSVEDGAGFDLNSTEPRSSGLGLVSGLARQLGGMFTVERGVGARCVVRFSDAGAR